MNSSTARSFNSVFKVGKSLWLKAKDFSVPFPRVQQWLIADATGMIQEQSELLSRVCNSAHL